MCDVDAILNVIVAAAGDKPRFMVAIAGPPGSGKSTLSHELVRRLPPGFAKVVEMDGFHYDNTMLEILGLRHRKGAPETFDYEGFLTLLQRLRRVEAKVAIPLFDREADVARAGAEIIDRQVRFIIIEGNYLLLREAPWSGLKDYFDLCLFLELHRDELEKRLLQRWLNVGYTQQRARDWVTSNDMPNVDRVLSGRPDEHCAAKLVTVVGGKDGYAFTS